MQARRRAGLVTNIVGVLVHTGLANNLAGVLLHVGCLASLLLCVGCFIVLPAMACLLGCQGGAMACLQHGCRAVKAWPMATFLGVLTD